MTQSDTYGLRPRILGSILVVGSYYLITHYVFSDPDFEDETTWIVVAAGGFPILQYFFQRFPGLMPRILMSILAGGVFYLIAHYVFSYRFAKGYGIYIAAVSGGFSILQNLSQRFRGLVPRIVIPILAGGLFYLIAHYGFSYSYAAGMGITITVASGLFFVFQYILE